MAKATKKGARTRARRGTFPPGVRILGRALNDNFDTPLTPKQLERRRQENELNQSPITKIITDAMPVMMAAVESQLTDAKRPRPSTSDQIRERVSNALRLSGERIATDGYSTSDYAATQVMLAMADVLSLPMPDAPSIH